ncbi:hypothetical protein L915_16951 [Phytophthora nicotianae]|uniref:Uncharacterized protein n=1 Tax=Phytophthora nicotianae TaxID=4792 RepID=W2G3A9_PHYNI|nr:hypothetical protein L915_16951 [Phytophthora nicotianae]ETL30133.1 hypothetical protein L916_16854 [Phytophthora nicotianae]
MLALQTTKNRAEFRRHTSLGPSRPNATRWSSTFMMLERYVRIRGAIKRVDAVYDPMPKPAAHRRIVALVESLKIFKHCVQEAAGGGSIDEIRAASIRQDY